MCRIIRAEYDDPANESPGLVRRLMLLLLLLNLPHFVQYKPVFAADGYDVAWKSISCFSSHLLYYRGR